MFRDAHIDDRDARDIEQAREGLYDLYVMQEPLVCEQLATA
ncbi:MAG: hypothetical protein ACLTKG_02600 [Collinsella intestinalis]